MLLCSIQLQHSAEHAMMCSKYVRLQICSTGLPNRNYGAQLREWRAEWRQSGRDQGSDNVTHSVWAGERLADLDIAVPESS